MTELWRLHCPCGEIIDASTEREIVDRSRSHLERDHPELAAAYSDEQILTIALSVHS